MKHCFTLMDILIARTAEHWVPKFPFFPWKAVTLLRSRIMMRSLLPKNNWSHFFTEIATAKQQQELLWISYPCWKFTNKNSSFNKMWLWHIQKIQHHQWSTNSFPIIQFLRNCCPSISRINKIQFLSLGFLKENVYKNNPHTAEELKQNNDHALQATLMKLFTLRHQTWGDECS